jgi:hypothetical protein
VSLGTSFEVSGKHFTLRYGNNALAELEGLLLMPITQIGERFTQGAMGVREMRAIFWAGLMMQHELSLVDAGHLMDELGLPRVAELVAQAFAAAFPNAQTPPKEVSHSPGTGTPS